MFKVKPLNRCDQTTQQEADPGTDYVGFTDGTVTHEFSHRDAKTWVREFGAKRSVPFRPLCDGYRGAARIERYYLLSEMGETQ